MTNAEDFPPWDDLLTAAEFNKIIAIDKTVPPPPSWSELPVADTFKSIYSKDEIYTSKGEIYWYQKYIQPGPPDNSIFANQKGLTKTMPNVKKSTLPWWAQHNKSSRLAHAHAGYGAYYNFITAVHDNVAMLPRVKDLVAASDIVEAIGRLSELDPSVLVPVPDDLSTLPAIQSEVDYLTRLRSLFSLDHPGNPLAKNISTSRFNSINTLVDNLKAGFASMPDISKTYEKIIKSIESRKDPQSYGKSRATMSSSRASNIVSAEDGATIGVFDALLTNVRLDLLGNLFANNDKITLGEDGSIVASEGLTEEILADTLVANVLATSQAVGLAGVYAGHAHQAQSFALSESKMIANHKFRLDSMESSKQSYAGRIRTAEVQQVELQKALDAARNELVALRGEAKNTDAGQPQGKVAQLSW